jgi:hypothetical protein
MAVSIFTAPIGDAIVSGAERGVPLETTARAVGISGNTAREWLRRGEGRDDRPVTEELASFAKRYRKAEADFIALAIGGIQAAGADSWQALAWLLERRFPDLFSTRVRETVKAELDEMIEHLESRLDPEVFATVVKAIAEAKAG